MPNTREKLVERLPVDDAILILREELKQRTEGYATHLSCGGKGDPAEEVNLDALAMAISALEQTKWIPVTERLPESGIEVLAMLQVNMFDGHKSHNVVTAVRLPSDSWLVADYQEGIEAETFGADCEDCCHWITHWMPLPESPEGE